MDPLEKKETWTPGAIGNSNQKTRNAVSNCTMDPHSTPTPARLEFAKPRLSLESSALWPRSCPNAREPRVSKQRPRAPIASRAFLEESQIGRMFSSVLNDLFPRHIPSSHKSGWRQPSKIYTNMCACVCIMCKNRYVYIHAMSNARCTCLVSNVKLLRSVRLLGFARIVFCVSRMVSHGTIHVRVECPGAKGKLGTFNLRVAKFMWEPSGTTKQTRRD